MLRALYDWTIRMADHPRALWVLAVISFAESSVFPIPPDVLMIPMITLMTTTITLRRRTPYTSEGEAHQLGRHPL